MMPRWPLLLGLVSLTASAQPGAFLPKKNKKPVSVSYEAVVRCYPELEDKDLAFRVDLGRLKDRLDARVATERSEMKSRVVKFRDADGSLRRMSVHDKAVTWETVGEDGVSQPWVSPALPKDADSPAARSLLARGRIEADDRLDREVKLGGLIVQVRRDLAKVVELRLESAGGKKALTCQDRGEFGSVCLCKL